MPGEEDAEIVTVAQEITRYFAAHPKAADKMEGIAKWWLTHQRLQESFELVQKALDYLVDQGKIKKTTNHDGETIYYYVSQNADNYY